MNQRVSTPSEVLEALKKPELTTIQNISLSPQDWLVLCAGFEDRAVAILENATPLRGRFNILLILYKPLVSDNKAEVIRKFCKKKDVKILELYYDREDPAGFGNKLVKSLAGCKESVYVDISAMSRLLIIQIIVALQERPGGLSNCFIAYTEAKDYPPNQEEAMAELEKLESDPTRSVSFLSSGILDITIVPELSSHTLAEVQTRLVIFPSLDAHQLTGILIELQPSRITFIEGTPPASHYLWRPEVIAKANHLEDFPNAERYQISTLNYQETVNCLQDLYAKYGIRERLLISPTGSKMQAVGVGIFRSFVKDVQIVYPPPRKFSSPKRYTIGVGKMHLLPLTPLSKNLTPK